MQMGTLNAILGIITAISGATAIVTLFMYHKQTVRTKNAEAFSKEVAALQAAVNLLKDQVKWHAEQLTEVQKLVTSKDVYIAQLTKEKHTLEIKHAKNKNAINTAHSCKNKDTLHSCPVLEQRARNEEEYVKEITKDQK